MIAAVYDWSGFYIGVNGGWGSSHKCWDFIDAGAARSSLAEGCHDATGGTAGGQVGYRWQAGTWVFGLEAPGQLGRLQGQQRQPARSGASPTSRKIDAFGLFTGQVGYAWNNVLFYVKGGAAVTDDRLRQSSMIRPASWLPTAGDDTRWGGAVGAGLEFGFAPNWSAGSNTTTCSWAGPHLHLRRRRPASSSAPISISQDVDLVTVRVNYRWGGPVIAKY